MESTSARCLRGIEVEIMKQLNDSRLTPYEANIIIEAIRSSSCNELDCSCRTLTLVQRLCKCLVICLSSPPVSPTI